jgi:hypothetical protein
MANLVGTGRHVALKMRCRKACRFESGSWHSGVLQLVEGPALNRYVVGSIPATRTGERRLHLSGSELDSHRSPLIPAVSSAVRAVGL